MEMEKHFFFKFQKRNYAFIQWRSDKNNNNEEIPLSIYFGKWSVNDRRLENRRYKQEIANLNKHHIKQIETFFQIEESKSKPYFWIFLPGKISLLQSNSNKIVDGPNKLKDRNGSYPKSIFCKLIFDYNKHELPEVFANINSNQKYNRKTISELSNSELKIADFLVNNKSINGKMSIRKEDILDFLSPLQFETLIFLLFVQNGNYCSTWRGGTLSKYDLKIHYKKSNLIFPKGISYIQLKKKKFDRKDNEDYYIIHTGKTNLSKKIIGKDWIFSEIEKNSYISEWLNFTLDFFKIE